MSTDSDPFERETDAASPGEAPADRRADGAASDAPDGGRDTPDDGLDDGRFAGFTLGDGDCIVYDTENQCAWIQSDAYVDIETAV